MIDKIFGFWKKKLFIFHLKTFKVPNRFFYNLKVMEDKT